MNPDDREMLVRIDERVKGLVAEVKKCNEDQENRIRALETWQNRLIGKIAIVTVAIAAAVNWFGGILSSVFTPGGGGT